MNIGVVLVTFNRINDLKKALDSYEGQTKKPYYIIVVNNNSSDGTKKLLDNWCTKEDGIKRYVLNLEENIGGSGGFYEGLKTASELDGDWIWVADDDAFPEKNAIEEAEKFIALNENKNDLAAVCGAVINNGKFDLNHRRRIKIGALNITEYDVPEIEYEKQYFNLELFSYVGSLINKKYLQKVGLTEKDYFIYYDDTEHSYRLSKCGKILCNPKIRVIHDTYAQNRDSINWKEYYGIRNRMLFIKKHFEKKYFLYEYYKKNIKIIVKRLFRGKDSYHKLVITALNDANNGKKGIHDIYKPGWKYNK